MADETAGTIRCDVAVVGSGPAGMSAAMTLSGKADVVLIERLGGSGFRRYHSICGEAVSDRMFDRLGWRPSSISARTSSISISSPGGCKIRVPVRGSIIDRPSMLMEMRDGCDARFIDGSVLSVSRGDSYTLSLSDGRKVLCDSLIGADGAHSAVRRSLFGTGPTDKLPIINCIASGDGGDDLAFTVGGGYAGGYSWRFPSSEGRVSVGFPRGCGTQDDIEGLMSWGARDLPFGVLDRVVDGNCLLVGDAACLANPLCYGGIGVAMLSGKRASEAVLKGRPGTYGKWISRSLMFDRRFMDAHKTFSRWTDDEIEDAMAPFAKGYSVPRGVYAILRRPRWSNVYIATFLAFYIGW